VFEKEIGKKCVLFLRVAGRKGGKGDELQVKKTRAKGESFLSFSFSFTFFFFLFFFFSN